MTEKICNTCNEAKPLTEYSPHGGARDGRQPKCKPCSRAWQRAYRRRSPEKVRESASRTRAANRDKISARDAAYRAANADKISARNARYRAENPHKDWEGHYRTRARRFGFAPRVEPFTRDELIAHWGNGARCIYCDGPFEELEHLVPVRSGGAHSLGNCAPSCTACNRVSVRDITRATEALNAADAEIQETR